jgi:hypothetical protein
VRPSDQSVEQPKENITCAVNNFSVCHIQAVIPLSLLSD